MLKFGLGLMVAATALACAQAPVKQEGPVAQEPDPGPLPLSLQPHFACGQDKLRRQEAEEAADRARRSLAEAQRAQGVDPGAIARLEGDLATAEKNRDEAARALAECQERVVAERKDRIARADTRPVRQLRLIPEDERLDGEKARIQKDDARLRTALGTETGRLMGPIVSTLLCATVGARQAVADELKALQSAPKKQVKQSKARIEELKAKTAAGDALVAGLMEELAKASSQPMACEDPQVAGLGDCLTGKAAGEKPESCADPKLEDWVVVWEYLGVDEQMKDRWTTSL